MVVLVGGIIIGQNTIESGMVSVFVMTCVALCFWQHLQFLLILPL